MRNNIVIAYIFASLMSYANASDTCKESDRAGMLKCHEVALASKDADIARALKKVANELASNPMTKGSVAADQLHSSQLAWEQYRLSYCSTVGISTSGPNEWSPLHQAGCAEDLSELRLKELQALLAMLMQ